MARGAFVYRGFEIARGESMIVNYLQFLKGQGQPDLMTACNDMTVKIFDLQSMKPKLQFQFTEPINVAA